MNPELVSYMVDAVNIVLTSLIIICNYIREAFGKYAILPLDAVRNVGTVYMEVYYGPYQY